MNPSDKDELIHRWLDGEVDAEEAAKVKSMLESDPELRAEVESLRALSKSLKAEVPADITPPSADFFNHHIRRQIEEAIESDPHAEVAPEAASKGIFSWLGLPWAVAAAAVVALLVLQSPQPGVSPVGGAESVVAAAYTPVEGVTAETYYSADAEATVIRLDGLAAMPDELEVEGHAAVSYPENGAMASNKLRDADGKVLFVMLGSAQGGAPTFFKR